MYFCDVFAEVMHTEIIEDYDSDTSTDNDLEILEDYGSDTSADNDPEILEDYDGDISTHNDSDITEDYDSNTSTHNEENEDEGSGACEETRKVAQLCKYPFGPYCLSLASAIFCCHTVIIAYILV